MSCSNHVDVVKLLERIDERTKNTQWAIGILVTLGIIIIGYSVSRTEAIAATVENLKKGIQSCDFSEYYRGGN